MAMTDKVQIALYSTDTLIPVSKADSTSSFNDLGVTDPMTDPGWFKLYVYGMNKFNQQLAENSERVGGIIVQSRRQKILFRDVPVQPFIFPSDMTKLDQFYALCRKRYIFLYKGEYLFTDEGWEIHPDKKALCVAIDYSVEDDYEHGNKILTFTARTKYPIG